MPPARDVMDRLLEKVVMEPNSGCWLWIGSACPRGYGSIGLNGVTTAVHRLSYERHVGPIRDGLSVLHKCDTPQCIRPDHLFLGTPKDNTQDMLRKGRVKRTGKRFGSNHCQAKLSESQVAEILKTPGLHKDVASRFGVTDSTVSLIKRRKIWRHVSLAA